jgi:hypothetical protein
VKNYNCKEGLHENERAYRSPPPRIIEVAIAEIFVLARTFRPDLSGE